MAANDYVILRDKAYTPTKKSLLKLMSQDALLAQNKLLANQIETLMETLNKLPQWLHYVQHASSSMMQVGGFTLCSGAHKLGMCMTQEEMFKEVNYMANPNRQGYHQGGKPGYHQGGNFSQNQGQG